MTELLKDKTAIVTGGAKGLGKAIATALDASGARVVVADIDGDGAQQTASQLAHGEGAACDVRDDKQVEELLGWVTQRHGPVDIMVANAGIASVAPIAEMSQVEWRSVLDVNLDGVYSSVRHAGRSMAGNGGGAIITMASITGFAGSPLISHYAAAKAGVISLTRSAAVEWRDHGVRVNAICPGFIGTDLLFDRVPQFESALGVSLQDLIAQKQGRLGTVDDVAPLAVFLASERSRFCSGSAFVVDGGMDAALV